MAKDVRQLRDEATAATAAGKHKRALECYQELERLETADAQWPKKIAETYRKLGKNGDAVTAYERAAERYAKNGFMVQAIAVCKLILQLDPSHQETQKRLASMTAEQSGSRSQISTLSESHPSLHGIPAVANLRRTDGHAVVPRPPERLAQDSGANPVVTTPNPPTIPPSTAASPSVGAMVDELARPRTRSKPITLSPGSPLSSVALSDHVAGARELHQDGSRPGIMLIPIEDEQAPSRDSGVAITIEPPGDDFDIDASELEDAEELDLADIEEIPLPAPKRMSASARAALLATPLIAAMSAEAVETLITRVDLHHVDDGHVLFAEGDSGDALFVVVEGIIALSSSGPPQVEMQRLGPGTFFGEVALITDTPRTATATAVGDTDLLRIGRDTLAILLEEHPDALQALLRFVRERLVDRWTRTSPLFQPFDAKERATLVKRFRFLEIEGGTHIVNANTKPEGLFIILAGHAMLQRSGGAAVTIGPGDLLAESALMTGAKLAYDAVAEGKCFALCLPASDFREIIMTHPHVLEYVGESEQRKLEMT